MIAVLTVLALLQAPRDTLRLYAVGDINLGRHEAVDHLLKGDTLYPFRAVMDALRGADILFGNLESPIAPDARQVESAGMVFTAPPFAGRLLARAGFTIVSTANNHAWDGGSGAAAETLEALSDAGVRFVGSGFGRDMARAPVIVEARGWRVAFFAVTLVWNFGVKTFARQPAADYVAFGDPAWLYPAIRRLRARHGADLIVVSVHGGTEYAAAPPPAYRRFLEGLVDAGADLVLAHHPHVLQPVLWRHGRPIVQSLGNFVFAQDRPWTRLGAILRVTVAPDRRIRLSAVPVRAGFQVTLAGRAAADSVRRRLGLSRSSMADP